MNLIIALLEAIPVLDKWFRELQLAYLEKKRIGNDTEFLQAMDKARFGDVKDLQRAIGELLDD